MELCWQVRSAPAKGVFYTDKAAEMGLDTNESGRIKLIKVKMGKAEEAEENIG